MIRLLSKLTNCESFDVCKKNITLSPQILERIKIAKDSLQQQIHLEGEVMDAFESSNKFTHPIDIGTPLIDQYISLWENTLDCFLRGDTLVKLKRFKPENYANILSALCQNNMHCSKTQTYESAQSGTSLDLAVCITLKGKEVEIPNGYRFKDKDETPKGN